MHIAATTLTRAASICAAAAGLIFVGVQVGHPPLDASTITTTEVTIRSTAKLVMGALALGGITGIYLHQFRQAGFLGLVGYLLLSAFYLLLMPVEFMAGYVLPSFAESDPQLVNDVLAVAEGGSAAGDIGRLQPVFILVGLLYAAGGVTFGVALFRAGVLARWAAALLVVGTVATLALAALPESFNRPFAVPAGVALFGLGISLWRKQARKSHESPVVIAAPDRAGVL